MKMTCASRSSDSDLVSELSRLAVAERAATVAFLVHLAEFDARRLHAAAGFSSTFAYCVQVLHLSEDAACNRIGAARAARTFPAILDMLVAGALGPTTARLLRPYLTPGNQQDLLAAVAGRSRHDTEKLLAARFPQPDVPSSIRKLPTRAVPRACSILDGVALASAVAVPALDAPALAGFAPPLAGSRLALAVPMPVLAGPGAAVGGTERAPSTTAPAMPEARALAPAPAPRPTQTLRPLSTDRYDVRFTASGEVRDLIKEAQDLLGHAIPGGDLARVFGRALRLLVEDLRKKKAGAESAVGGHVPGQDSRYIPAGVRRRAWDRDGGRCAFVAADGRRCAGTRRLEFHHDRVPYGVGGRATLDNISLRCQTHNEYEAAQFYGPGRARGGIDESVRPRTDRAPAG